MILATRQTFAAAQSSSMVAFFVFTRFFESFDGDLDADLVAEFKAVRDSFYWIEHANDCACNPVFLNSKVTCLSGHADKPY
jgi:hypothetical protein